VIVAVAFVVVLLSVVLARGDLRRISTLRFRWIGLVFVALAIQIVIISILKLPHDADVAFHIASYVVIAVFLAVNWRIPGVWLITVGAVLNFAAISVNGGVMPANAHALRVAGMDRNYAHAFENSQALKHERLHWLGDEFALPKSWPVHNVYSVGDVLILVGAAVGVHQICRSRLTRSGRRSGVTP